MFVRERVLFVQIYKLWGFTLIYSVIVCSVFTLYLILNTGLKTLKIQLQLVNNSIFSLLFYFNVLDDV